MDMNGLEPCFADTSSVPLGAILTQSDSSETTALKAMLRGERPAKATAEMGLRRDRYPSEMGVAEKPLASLTVCASDLAAGILRHKDDPVALEEWANFMLMVMTSKHLVFESEESDFCELLLSSIWQVAFGAPLGQPAIRLAYAVRNRNPKA